MSRLVTFGCSNTVGAALPNSNIQSWPAVLSSMLDRECVNLAAEGSSARYAIYQMQCFEFRKDDIAVFMWPEPTRYCFINDDDTVQHIGVWRYKKDKRTSMLYKELFSNRHALYDCLLFNDYANLFFKDKGIQYFDYLGPYTFIDEFPLKHKMELKDYALDGRHPGVESHKYFAETVYRDMKENQ